MKDVVLAALLCLGALSRADAMGRKAKEPDEYPDYNRLEYHPKLPDPREADRPPQASTASVTSPRVRAEDSPPPYDDTTPRPPPQVVPVSPEASEPPMPDEIVNTLSAPTTAP